MGGSGVGGIGLPLLSRYAALCILGPRPLHLQTFFASLSWPSELASLKPQRFLHLQAQLERVLAYWLSRALESAVLFSNESDSHPLGIGSIVSWVLVPYCRGKSVSALDSKILVNIARRRLGKVLMYAVSKVCAQHHKLCYRHRIITPEYKVTSCEHCKSYNVVDWWNCSKSIRSGTTIRQPHTCRLIENSLMHKSHAGGAGNGKGR